MMPLTGCQESQVLPLVVKVASSTTSNTIFALITGVDTQGNQLFNAITGEQRLRVREIFDLFSRYAGIRFIETAIPMALL